MLPPKPAECKQHFHLTAPHIYITGRLFPACTRPVWSLTGQFLSAPCRHIKPLPSSLQPLPSSRRLPLEGVEGPAEQVSSGVLGSGDGAAECEGTAPCAPLEGASTRGEGMPVSVPGPKTSTGRQWGAKSQPRAEWPRCSHLSAQPPGRRFPLHPQGAIGRPREQRSPRPPPARSPSLTLSDGEHGATEARGHRKG